MPLILLSRAQRTDLLFLFASPLEFTTASFQFVSRVLAPELVVMLIQETSKVDADQAKKIKSESTRYGAAMFPSDKAAALQSQKGNNLWEKDEEEKNEKNRKKKEKKEEKEKSKSIKTKKKRKSQTDSKTESEDEENGDSDDDSEESEPEAYKPVASQSRRKASGPVEPPVSSKPRVSTPRKRGASNPIVIDSPTAPDASATSIVSKRPKPRPKNRNVSTSANPVGTVDVEMADSQSQDVTMDSQAQEDTDVEMMNSQSQANNSVIDLTNVSQDSSSISHSQVNSTLGGTGFPRSHLVWPSTTQETVPLSASQGLSQDSLPPTQNTPPSPMKRTQKQDHQIITIQDSPGNDSFKRGFTQIGKRDRETDENEDDPFAENGIGSKPFNLTGGSSDGESQTKKSKSSKNLVKRRNDRTHGSQESIELESSEPSDTDSEVEVTSGKQDKKGKGKDEEGKKSSQKKLESKSKNKSNGKQTSIPSFFKKSEDIHSNDNVGDSSQAPSGGQGFWSSELQIPSPSGKVPTSSSPVASSGVRAASKGLGDLRVSRSPSPPRNRNKNKPPASHDFELNIPLVE